ncbi:hypothetical protein [Desulfoluna butyratoxydans]|uniref:Uncharacterized protein n=1 Tax=Desulfoluna butyratoxydans TaxID=231438 RepID=A0A4U8YQR8_9BACT|nr:hypothetical protein [Desulfoluna butyratoxydans]VFQ45787.1 hypothetical protein MSL71_34490 [Desulfoluna butyratoxydans]
MVTDTQTHSGHEQPEESDFFAPPPEHIGEILSAHTSLKRGDTPQGWGRRLATALVSTGVGALLGYGLARGLDLPPWEGPFFLWVTAGLILGFLLGMDHGVFRGTCTYVGSQGLAEYTLKGSRCAVPKEKKLRFDEVCSLHVDKTENYGGLIYRDTSFDFAWKDRTGAIRYRIAGAYTKKGGSPDDPGHLYYYGMAAEDAWNSYELDRMLLVLENGGNIPFQVKDLTIELGLGHLNIYEGQRRLKLDVAHISSISLSRGIITVHSSKPQARGWFSSSGKDGSLSFDYDDMPNATLFFWLVKTLAEGGSDSG